MAKLKLGVVGLGMAVKPHAGALKELSDKIELVGGWSPSAERRAAFAQTYGLKTVDDDKALFEGKGTDALLVLTPPWTHLDIVKRAAAAGKHVLLEKPVETTVARALEAVEAAERAKRTLAIVFQHRFRPAALRLAEVLAAGALGKLLSISASVRWWRPPEYYLSAGRGTMARDGGGVLLTQAVHTLDLLLSLVGPAASVTALVDRSGLRAVDTEDVVAATIRFANGASGVLDATTAAYPGYPERIEIAGTKGSAFLQVNELTVQLMDGKRESFGTAEGSGGGADPMAFSHAWHKAVIGDFADAIAQGRAPRTSGRSALPAQALITALLEAGA
ncbi:MAG: Gfo/Idh/MocA family oxidoreductase, partial [Alphaproteobacteria bacterium]|nr:Gfo/Idh/MocA family oxidoreductase [Alphaproteobacteria bacterium]